MIWRNMSYSYLGKFGDKLNYYQCELICRGNDQWSITLKLSQMANQLPRLVSNSDHETTLPINASHALSFAPTVRPCTRSVYKNKEFSD